MFADQYKVGESSGQRAAGGRRGSHRKRQQAKLRRCTDFVGLSESSAILRSAQRARHHIPNARNSSQRCAFGAFRWVELLLDSTCLTCDVASQMPTGHSGVSASPSASGNAPARAHSWRLNNPVDCSKALFPAERPDWAVIYGTARRGKSSAFGRAAQAARRARGCGAA